MHEHGHSTGRRLLGRTLALGVLAVAAVAVTVVRVDATTASPITDVSGYPAAHPAGCPDGESALVGLTFDNGRGGSAASLWGLDVGHGDTVTMRWSAFHASCTTGGEPAIAVALAAYDAPTAAFDPAVDQRLDTWEACGAGADACTFTDGRYRLRLTLPTTDVCNVQVDAVLGLPLAVVGPGGSFYSSGARGSGPNRLLSAANFTVTPCAPTTTVAPVSTSSPPPPSTTPTSVAPNPVTTIAPAVASTTSVVAPANYSSSTVPAEVTTTTAAPPGPTLVHNSGSTPIDQPPPSSVAIGETKVLAETAERSGPLPFTGATTLAVLAVAAVLSALGAVALFGSHRARRPA